MATTTKKITEKIIKTKVKPQKKLSKAGEWLLKHPNGIGEIIDMEAVLK